MRRGATGFFRFRNVVLIRFHGCQQTAIPRDKLHERKVARLVANEQLLLHGRPDMGIDQESARLTDTLRRFPRVLTSGEPAAAERRFVLMSGQAKTCLRNRSGADGVRG